MWRIALSLVVACRRPEAVTVTPPPVVAHVAIDAAVALPVDADEPDPFSRVDPDASLAESFELDKVSIGPLHLGTSGADVVRSLGKPKSKSKPVMMGATGAFISEWDFGDVSLQMAGSSETSPAFVSAINVAGASRFKTNGGIGIGSSFAEVRAVYGPYLGHTEDADLVLVGSIYGGMLLRMDHDHVVAIFIGAMAF